MRQLKSIFILLLALGQPLLAVAEQSSRESNPRPQVISLHDEGASGFADEWMSLPRKAVIKHTSSQKLTFRDIVLSQAGTLAAELGDNINDIDSLVVSGPVNDADIYTMWECSFYGGTTVINLENATVQDNRLPEHAFYYQSEQYTFGEPYIECIPLRRIILPEGLREIGEMAFSYAIALEDINLPSTLKEIKKYAFSDCISLNVDPLIIPEGVEEIGYGAFVECKSLTGEVILPSTLNKISSIAFFQTKISKCNFPEGLEEIGNAAFYATRLKEAILPNTCQLFSGDSHFKLDYELERVHFPEGVKVIPMDFVNNCVMLTEFDMPESVEEIREGAFWQCGSLQELRMPNNLKSIGKEGLYYCKGLKSISIPATLETLGAESCENWKRIEEIHCAAPIPPICMASDLNPGNTPFGDYDYDFINRTPEDIPVYVPVGSAELYRNAWGWDYFTNYIEMDFSGIKETVSDKGDDIDVIYDLYGRKVTEMVPNHIYIKNRKKIFKH